jgi:hypothetical protein
MVLIIGFTNLLKHHLHPVFQVLTLMYMNLCYAIYIARCQPFESKELNTVEMINSFLVFVVSIFMLYYARYPIDSEWSFIQGEKGDGIYMRPESKEYLDFTYRSVFISLCAINIIYIMGKNLMSLVFKAHRGMYNCQCCGVYRRLV